MKSLKSLLVTTSSDQLADTQNKTGVWLEDLAAPYYILKDEGELITIVSPKGGQIPLDPNCLSTEHTRRFQQDTQAMYHFSHSLPLNEVKATNYDLLFIAGGYGAMQDLPDNQQLQQILQSFIRREKPIGLVGHAVAALVSLIDADGQPFVKGRKLTGFSNSEERSAKLMEEPPFLLESLLTELGATYTQGPDFASFVIADGNLITGQNPASALETARQLLSLTQKRHNSSFERWY